MHAFDEDTAVELDPGDGSVRTGRALLADRWNVGDKPNGGYLLAVAGRALAGALRHPDPFSVTAHYLSPPAPGPAQVEVHVTREGRSLSTGSVVLSQAGRPRVQALGTFGVLPDSRSTGEGRPREVTTAPPTLPAPPDCWEGTGVAPDGRPLSLQRSVEIRLDPAVATWTRGQPSGEAAVRAWVRFRDGRPMDPLALLLASDVLPPTTFNLGLTGWVPTLELTVHVRASPAAGWLRVAVVTRNLDHGLFEEDAEVWDCEDRLVAQSRQLAMLLPAGRG